MRSTYLLKLWRESSRLLLCRGSGSESLLLMMMMRRMRSELLLRRRRRRRRSELLLRRRRSELWLLLLMMSKRDELRLRLGSVRRRGHGWTAIVDGLSHERLARMLTVCSVPRSQPHTITVHTIQRTCMLSTSASVSAQAVATEVTHSSDRDARRLNLLPRASSVLLNGIDDGGRGWRLVDLRHYLVLLGRRGLRTQSQ